MFKRFLSVFIATTCYVIMSAQVSETFSTGNLSSIWLGESSKYGVEEGRLTLSDEGGEASSAYLSTHSIVAVEGSWEFDVHIGCKTSSSNYARFYLTSSSPALNESLTGYFVQIGNTNKQVVLYKSTGSSVKILGQGIEKRLDTTIVDLSVRVIRSKEAEWKVYTKLGSESQFSEEVSVIDSSYSASAFCGVYCKYSKANTHQFSFDNIVIKGTGPADKSAPKVTSFVPSDTLLQINFDEWINEDKIEIELSPSIPHHTSWNGAHTQLSLQLDEDLQEGTKYVASVRNIRDYVGNTSDDTSFVFAHKEAIAPQDIIFTEVLFNPNTGGSEFVEIYNRSQKVIDLSELKFSTRKAADSTLYSPKRIATDPCFIFPGEVKTLTNNIEGVTQFYDCNLESFILLSSFPSLRNEDGAIVLFRSADSLIIDNVYYEAATMHVEDVYNKGKGVSLYLTALQGGHWTSSSESDGYATPGFTKGLTEKPSGLSNVLSATEVCFPYYDESHQFHLRYQLNECNFQAYIKIYSMAGKCVRTLTEGNRLSTDGEIIWNGEDNNGRVVPIGPYLLRVELIHLATGERIHQSFVVLVSH